MPKQKENPGTGARLERVRERLGFESRPAFARACATPINRYQAWIYQGCAPSAVALKRVLTSLRASEGLRLRGLPALLSWLTDGEGPPPAWLDDPKEDPFGPAPPPVAIFSSGPKTIEELVAGLEPRVPIISEARQLELFPEAALVALMDARDDLEDARERGALRDPVAVRAWTSIDRAARALVSYEAWARLRRARPRDSSSTTRPGVEPGIVRRGRQNNARCTAPAAARKGPRAARRPGAGVASAARRSA